MSYMTHRHCNKILNIPAKMDTPRDMNKDNDIDMIDESSSDQGDNYESHHDQNQPRSLTKITGRWSQKEHQIFVDCLNKYGKDWVMLEKSITTRTSTQIRSHAQKYFNTIKEKFNVKDPYENINYDMEHGIHQSLNEMEGTGTRKNLKPLNLNTREIQSYEEYKYDDKRNTLKHKSHELSNKWQYRDSSSGTPVSYPTSKQKNLKSSYQSNSKELKTEEPSKISLSSSLLLENGQVSIKGNKIKTSIPCEIEHITLASGLSSTMVVPSEPSMLEVRPMLLDKPMIFDLNMNSFLNKSDNSQQIPRSSSEQTSNKNSDFDKIMEVLDQNYCMFAVKGHCGESSECQMSSMHSPESSSSNSLNQSRGQSSSNNSQPVEHNTINNAWARRLHK